ncbi:MAG: AAA family ATPase [Mycobacteriales bacterium]
MSTHVEALVGRARELAGVVALLEGLQAGHGRLLLLTGEAGIGKTRLARELAGRALATGTSVVWGRCVESEGAPAYWPWRQVVESLGADPDAVFGGRVESPEERFRLVDEVLRLLAVQGPLVVVLDDLHDADEVSLSLLRHVADRLVAQPLLLVVTAREAGPALSELLRTPDSERWELRRLDVADVATQLPAPEHAEAVHQATGGNPMFVREVARAIGEGSWDPGRPPRTVIDAVAARLERLTPTCRSFLQVAAVVGRDFELEVVAAACGTDEDDLLSALDEAVRQGLVENQRFTHALVRDAVELSLGHGERRDLHRRVGTAVAARHVAHLADHFADLVRHAVAAGDARAAHEWAAKGAGEAVRRLAFEEAVRLYRVAVAHDSSDVASWHGLARSAYYAGDLDTWVDAVRKAADLTRGTPAFAEAALLLEAMPDPTVMVLAGELCREALDQAQLDDATRARLLGLMSHLAFYDGDTELTASRSREAIELARASGDDSARVAALRARQEALPGPAGRAERLVLADEMVLAAQRLGSARNEMWGRLWRVEALAEQGDFPAAEAALPDLAAVVQRVGGPVSSWHLGRVSACIAQAQGRYAEAAALSDRALEQMSAVEPTPARGAWFAMQAALAGHIGVSERALEVARTSWDPPPRFVTMGRLSRAFLLTQAGLPEDARTLYLQAGPPPGWTLPVFFVQPGLVLGTRVAISLGLLDDVRLLLPVLEELRGEHALGGGVSYLGPMTLTLGGARAALGDPAAAGDLRTAIAEAERAGAPGFAAEARLILAELTGDRVLARQADAAITSLGMTALMPRSSALLHTASPLSGREEEVSRLVAEGLSNRQIAERLVISERTAQNHVQHVLMKLDLSNRAQITAWVMSR